MRRFLKPAVITVAAAAATFAFVANMGGSPLASSPAAKASTFCEPEQTQPINASTIIPVPFEIDVPTLPSIPPINTEIPCIPLPTLTEFPPLPVLELPDLGELPTIELPELPNLHDLLQPIEVPIPTLPTTDNVIDGMVAN